MKLSAMLLAVSIVCGRTVVSACSMVHIPPITYELQDRAAISGVVLDYVSDRSILASGELVPGLAISIQEQLLGPRSTGTAQVLLVAYDPACDDVPEDLDRVRREYPVGTSVSIIGTIRGTQSGRLVLVSSLTGFGYVARIPEALQRTAAGALDFAAMRREYEASSYQAFSPEIASRNAHRGWFEDFEYLRALQMLGNAEPAQRRAMAENLIDYRGWRGYNEAVAFGNFKRLLESYGIPVTSRPTLEHRFRGSLH